MKLLDTIERYKDLEEVKPGYFLKTKNFKNEHGEIIKRTFIKVCPITKEIDKPFSFSNIHWKNFLIGGSWSNVVFVLLLLLLIYSYSVETEQCRWIIQNSVEFCKNMTYMQPMF